MSDQEVAIQTNSFLIQKFQRKNIINQEQSKQGPLQSLKYEKKTSMDIILLFGLYISLLRTSLFRIDTVYLVIFALI